MTLPEETLKIQKYVENRYIALNAEEKRFIYTINRLFFELKKFIKSRVLEIIKINLSISNIESYENDYKFVLAILDNYGVYISDKIDLLKKFINSYKNFIEIKSAIDFIEDYKENILNIINFEDNYSCYIDVELQNKIQKENKFLYDKCVEIRENNLNIRNDFKTLIKKFISKYENLEVLFIKVNAIYFIDNNKEDLIKLIDIKNSLSGFISDNLKKDIKKSNKKFYDICIEINEKNLNLEDDYISIIVDFIAIYDDLDNIFDRVNAIYFVDSNKEDLMGLIQIEKSLSTFINDNLNREIKNKFKNLYNECIEINKKNLNLDVNYSYIIVNFIAIYDDLDNIFDRVNAIYFIEENKEDLMRLIDIEKNLSGFISDDLKKDIKDGNKAFYERCVVINKKNLNLDVNYISVVVDFIAIYDDLDNIFDRVNAIYFIEENKEDLMRLIDIENTLPDFINDDLKKEIKKKYKKLYKKCFEINKNDFDFEEEYASIINKFIVKYLKLNNIFKKINYIFWVNENNEYLIAFNRLFEGVPNQYISNSLQIKIKDKLIGMLKKINNFNKNHGKLISNVGVIDDSLKYFTNFEKQILIANENYIKNELKNNEIFFDNINRKSLDEYQRRAIVVDDDNIQINAGAGTGKTLTLQGKVKYLVEKKNVKPSELLLLSYSNSSTADLKSKIDKVVSDVEVTTFHAFGRKILKEFNKPIHIIDYALNDVITDFFKKELFNKKRMKKNIVELFSYYFYIPTNKDKIDYIGEVYDNEKNVNFYSIRSKINKKESLKGEWMKSLEELLIANFLYIHDIDYVYEKRYQIKNKYYKTHFKNFKKLLFSNKCPSYIQDEIIRPIADYVDITSMTKMYYNPDFYLPEYDIYLEHFGVNKKHETPWLNDIESKKYKEGIKWKRALHKKHGTKLIETYSFYQNKNRLLINLKEKLIKEGVEVKEPNYDYIYQELIINNQINEYESLIKLFTTFINLFKGNDYDKKKFKEFSKLNKEIDDNFIKTRNKLFLSIVENIYLNYEKYLKENDAIDFNDMINNAVECIENNNIYGNYKYIIVDEYQDTSFTRYKLLKALKDKLNSKILVVGDDWQSIYQFNGCDISLFTKIDEYFDKPLIIDILNTYRNSQAIVDVAGNFIKKNKHQYQKSLISKKRASTRKKYFHFYYYDNNQIEVFEEMIKDISNLVKKPKILILGRNNYDLKNLIKLDKKNLFIIKGNMDQDKYLSLIYKGNANLDIKFRTVHKSKGLEEDYVILINLTDKEDSFPNKIGYDPIISTFVLRASDEDINYAEERRLFYVALTRAKKLNFLLVPTFSKSDFIRELEEKEKYIKFVNKKDFITEKDLASFSNEYVRIPTHLKCPVCGTGIVTILINTKKNWKRFVCSQKRCNYKGGFYNGEIEDINKIEICPKCNGILGFKTKYKDFKGCSNYPGCDYLVENYDGVKKRYDIINTGFKCIKCGGKIEIRTNKENGKCFVKCKDCGDFKGNLKNYVNLTDLKQCPNCGGVLVKRKGKYSTFWGCSAFPKCNFKINNDKDNAVNTKKYGKCPMCGGYLKKRNGKKGSFLGCSNYPDCNYIRDMTFDYFGNEVPVDYGHCPICNNSLRKNNGKNGPFLGCSSYPNCTYTLDIEINDYGVECFFDYGFCPKCGGQLRKRKGRKGTFLGCSNYPKCKYSRNI